MFTIPVLVNGRVVSNIHPKDTTAVMSADTLFYRHRLKYSQIENLNIANYILGAS
jgi:hypothetical protein